MPALVGLLMVLRDSDVYLQEMALENGSLRWLNQMEEWKN